MSRNPSRAVRTSRAAPLVLLSASLAVLAACHRSQRGRELAIQGQVLSLEGEPIRAAAIRTLDGEDAALSDAAGRFVLRTAKRQTRAIVVDLATAAPRGSFRMRMNLPEAQGDVIRLPAPMHVPVDDVAEQTIPHGLAEQTIVSALHPGASITIQRGSLRDQDGVVLDPPPAMSLLYIPPHLLPGGMPGEQISSVVFSVQPSGLRIDPPARISFPNYDGFAPNETVPLMAMNPDSGEWVAIGTATVDASGTSIVSDPGSGVRWTSCTGCCYPPCFVDLGGRVTREVVRGQNTAEEPVADALVIGPGGRQARTDREGRYRLNRVPLARARFGGGSQTVTLTAQFDPEGPIPPLRKTEERELACDASANVDFRFEGIVLSLFDDQNDGQAGSPRTTGIVKGVTADGDASAPERGTHVDVKLSIASPPEGLQVRVALAAPEGAPAGDLGRLAVDSSPGDGRIDGPAGLETERIDFGALRTERIKLRWLAPVEFGDAEDRRRDGRERRRVLLRAEGFVDGERVLASLTPLEADVVRPQVLFLHGWGGSSESFTTDFSGEFEGTLGRARSSRRASPPFLDYGAAHSSTMSVVVRILLPQFASFDAELLDGDRLASTRYDVAAHSYGGLQARRLIAHWHAAGELVRIRSLATLGTPHLGAELADRGLNLAQEPAVPGSAADLSLLRNAGGQFLSEQTIADLDASDARSGAWHELSTLVRMREEGRRGDSPPLPGDLSAHLLPLDFGFIGSVRYRLFRSAASGWADRQATGIVEWASGCRSRAGDGIVPAPSASAGVETPGLREELPGSLFHTDLTDDEGTAQRVRAFFAGVAATAVPSPSFDNSGPILRWMDRVDASDLPGHETSVVFRGHALRGVESTQLRFETRRGPRTVTLLPNQVGDDEVRYDFRQWMSTPNESERMASGYVRVIVDGVASNGLYLQFPGESLRRPGVNQRGPVPAGVGGASTTRVLEIDHGDPVLHDPVVLLWDLVLVPRIVSTQPLQGDYRSVAEIELPARLVSGELRVAEGLREASEPVAFGVTPSIHGLEPASTCVGMTVRIDGRWFGTARERVELHIGGVPQPVLEVAPDAIRFVVADGTRSAPVELRVAGVAALEQPRLQLGEDGDFDGMPDAYELAEGLRPDDPRDALLDLDGDRVVNREEYRRGLRAALADSDGGGVDDGEELRLGLDPRDPADDDGDGDGDGLTRGEELALGTDPLRFDTDGDQLGDGTEVRGGIRGIVTDPLDADGDDDRLVDGEELLGAGTDPRVPDTDGDARGDGDELHGLDGAPPSDPLDRDTDDDGLEDGAEVGVHRTNPRLRDSDGDGLDDRDELQRGLDPLRADSDGDGLGDGLELAAGSNPLVAGPSTVLVGRVQFADGSAAPAATVSVTRVPLARFGTQSAADGSFAFASRFPADVPPIVVTASARDPNGVVKVGRSGGVALQPGTTDAGTLRLDLLRALIVTGLSRSSEPGNTQVMTSYFQSGLSALAIESDLADEVPVEIDAGYALVCDLRFSNVFGLPAHERSTFASWLAPGRTLIVHGENSGFAARNFAIQDWLIELGGGFVSVATQNGAQQQACTHPQIGSTPNQVAQVGFAVPGRILDPGLGARVTSESIAAWRQGQLTQSPNARIVLVMDINMWTGALGTGNRPFFENLIHFATR